MKTKKVSPYSFTVKKESSKAFSYQVTCHPYKNPLAGGIGRSASDSTRCARQDIARLEAMALPKEKAA